MYIVTCEIFALSLLCSGHFDICSLPLPSPQSPPTLPVFSPLISSPVTSLIDAYTPTSVLSSPATVPLGTTVVLVCRVGGVASGTQLSYTWTCPKQHCNLGPDQGPSLHKQTFEDRMVITAMSPDDSGDYTCLVHDHLGGTLSTEKFTLTVTGMPTDYTHLITYLHIGTI